MASGKRSPLAANPSRKCAGWPKQSPGTIRTPRLASLRQNSRVSVPFDSHGNAVIPPRGLSQCKKPLLGEKLIEEQKIRLCYTAGARIDFLAVLKRQHGKPLAEHITGDGEVIARVAIA